MSCDEGLANRISQLIGQEPGLSEKKMFGGLAFLVNGNMAISASGQGGLLVRVDPSQTNDLVASTPAETMVMRGRSMPGWLRVGSSNVSEDAELNQWVRLGLIYAQSLPPKN